MKILLKTKPFAWIIMLVIFIVGSTAIVGCNRNDDKEINQSILNTITEIERSNYELNALTITYDEYNIKTDKYLSKYLTSFYKPGYTIYAEDEFVFAYTGKHYDEKDWKGLSLSELKVIGEPLYQSLSLQKPGYFYTSFDLSEVYDDNSNSTESMHYKYVFTKYTYKNGNDVFTGYKQYSFKKEIDDYFLFEIKFIRLDTNKELLYKNEKVEFIDSISLK